MKQNEAQYDLDRQTAKILALSSGNLEKYQFLTGKDVLLETALKKETDIAKKKQYQILNKVYEFDEVINENNRKPTLKKIKSNI